MSDVNYLHSIHSKFADTDSASYIDYDLWRKRYQRSAGRSWKVLNKIQVRETYADLFNSGCFRQNFCVPDSIKTTKEFIDWMKSDEH